MLATKMKQYEPQLIELSVMKSTQSTTQDTTENKDKYKSLGRLIFYYAGLPAINALRVASVSQIATVLGLPILKQFNCIENYVMVALLQQALFIGIYDRLDTVKEGKITSTILQCAFLGTSFYSDYKATLIACSLSMCLPIKYSKPKDFVINLNESIKELFNFNIGIENAKNK